MNNSFFTSTLRRESFDRVTSCAQQLMMNQPFEGAAAAAAAEVVDKNRNNFSHTTPKELRTVAKDAGSRWEEVIRKSALESKIHKCKSGFDQWGGRWGKEGDAHNETYRVRVEGSTVVLGRMTIGDMIVMLTDPTVFWLVGRYSFSF